MSGRVIPIEELRPIKDMLDFTGKKALVTGAAQGIGLASAVGLASLGADVALADLNFEKAQKAAEFIAKKYSVKALAVAVDVSDPVSVREMIDTVVAELGALDCVHSNVGLVLHDDNANMSYQNWKKEVDINLTGTFLVDQAACQWMRENDHPGSIVNTASMSGHIINRLHVPHNVCYSATKAAIINLTKGMAVENIDYGIRVNCVSPGYIDSGVHEKQTDEYLAALINDVPCHRFGTLDEVAGPIIFLLSDMASYCYGTDLLCDGGHTIW